MTTMKLAMLISQAGLRTDSSTSGLTTLPNAAYPALATGKYAITTTVYAAARPRIIDISADGGVCIVACPEHIISSAPSREARNRSGVVWLRKPAGPDRHIYTCLLACKVLLPAESSAEASTCSECLGRVSVEDSLLACIINAPFMLQYMQSGSATSSDMNMPWRCHESLHPHEIYCVGVQQ